MGKHEVSQAQYEVMTGNNACLSSTPSHYGKSSMRMYLGMRFKYARLNDQEASILLDGLMTYLLKPNGNMPPVLEPQLCIQWVMI